MNKERILFCSVAKGILLLSFFLLHVDCGAALTFQEQEQMAQQQNDTSTNSILTALGLSGAGGSGIIHFSKSSLSFTTAVGSASYTIAVPAWPTTDPGVIYFSMTWSGTMACSNPSPNTYNFANDQGYPMTSSSITFSCAKPGSGQINHQVTSAPASASSLIGQSIGIVSVTVLP